jgi:hypothetical protein
LHRSVEKSTEQAFGFVRNPSLCTSHRFVTRLLTSAACSVLIAPSGRRDRSTLRATPAVHM